MTVGHSTLARTAMANAVVDLLDGLDPGKLVFMDEFGVPVATLELSNPAFGDAAFSEATANAINPDPGAVGGDIAYAVFRNSADADVFDCSVTALGGGGEIELTTITVGVGQAVTMELGLTYAAPF